MDCTCPSISWRSVWRVCRSSARCQSTSTRLWPRCLFLLAASTLPKILIRLLLNSYADEKLPVASVQKLRTLEGLIVCALFDRPLTAEEVAVYTPPSALMPALRSFTCIASD